MRDIYENDLEMQVIRANREGDLELTKKIFASGELDILSVTKIIGDRPVFPKIIGDRPRFSDIMT